MESELSPSTQAQMLSALRSFLSWTGSMGGHRLPADMVAVALKTPRSTVRQRYSVLSEKEIAAILASAPGARERALLGVLLGAGIRVAEAAALCVSDIIEELDGGTSLFIRQGKGRKDRIVPIDPGVDGLLRAYLVDSHRFLGDEGRLFLAKDRGAVSRGDAGLTPRSIGRLVTELAHTAGIEAKRVTPHSLRHSYAIRCLRNNGNVVAVSKLLGHSSIATTQRYVDHLAVSELRSSVPPLPLTPEPLAS
jgi:integrase/recombinase XerD